MYEPLCIVRIDTPYLHVFPTYHSAPKLLDPKNNPFDFRCLVLLPQRVLYPTHAPSYPKNIRKDQAPNCCIPILHVMRMFQFKRIYQLYIFFNSSGEHRVYRTQIMTKILE